jgi:hypothetical protein
VSCSEPSSDLDRGAPIFTVPAHDHSFSRHGSPYFQMTAQGQGQPHWEPFPPWRACHHPLRKRNPPNKQNQQVVTSVQPRDVDHQYFMCFQFPFLCGACHNMVVA